MHASFAYFLKSAGGSWHCEDRGQPILPWPTAHAGRRIATPGSNPDLSASEVANFFSGADAPKKTPELQAHFGSKPIPSSVLSGHDFGVFWRSARLFSGA
jgi:hypothetical protein